jgi:hypothetical protein
MAFPETKKAAEKPPNRGIPHPYLLSIVAKQLRRVKRFLDGTHAAEWQSAQSIFRSRCPHTSCTPRAIRTDALDTDNVIPWLRPP